MDWNSDISNSGKSWMEFLGNFSPTVNEQSRELKGYMHDEEGVGKVYLNSGELRLLATACIEVADWLDNRARFEAGKV